VHDTARDQDGDTGDGGPDAPDVGVRQTVLQDVALAALFRDFLLFRGLDATQDDILAARFLICSCASKLAPSPIASMAITEQTPNTMPRTVNSERSRATRGS